ncbi:MAG: 2-isopropylmalate synthase [Promethearchaeota archaeon]
MASPGASGISEACGASRPVPPVRVYGPRERDGRAIKSNGGLQVHGKLYQRVDFYMTERKVDEISVSPFMDSVREGTLLPEKVYFFDTTLRDGEQTPGITFTLNEKILIAQQLDRLGIDVIEAGFPITSEGDYEACKTIAKLGLSSEVMGLARCERADIDRVIECDMDSVHVFIATSELHMREKLRMSREEVLGAIAEWVGYAKDHYSTVLFSAEDATRSDLDFLVRANRAAVEAGATRVNIPDTVGTITPRAFGYLVRKNREALPAEVRIAVHCHDDFGLSTANTLAGLENGASEAQTTILGIGERAGNAAFEEVCMSAYALYGLPMNVDTRQIFPTAKLVESLSGERIPSQFPLVGKNAFRHEAGIHAHAMITNPRNYEPLTPELLGISRTDDLDQIIAQSITLGKHTGGHALRAKLQDLGLNVTDSQFRRIMADVKRFGDKGHVVVETELLAIIKDVLGDIPESQKMMVVEELTVLTGTVTPTSTVKVRVRKNGDYETRIASSVGVGPVDASMKAILEVTNEMGGITLEEYGIEAVTGGSDALGRVGIKLKESQTGKVYEARAVDEDIVMSSIKALVMGINKILWAQKNRA